MELLKSDNSRPVTILLVRHGETIWNHRGLYQGHGDPALSKVGIAQIRAAAAQLRRQNAQIILTSPLLRARQSAAILAEELAIPASEDRRLAEIRYGQWEGLSQPEIKMRWPALLRLWKTAPDEVVFPEGGSLTEVQDAVRPFLADAERATKNIIAVTHQGTIRVAVLTAECRPLAEFRQVRVAPGSITTLTHCAGHWILGNVHGLPLPGASPPV